LNGLIQPFQQPELLDRTDKNLEPFAGDIDANPLHLLTYFYGVSVPLTMVFTEAIPGSR